MYSRLPSRRGLPIHFFGHFCCRVYLLTTNSEEADRHQKQLQFENVSKKILMLTTAIPVCSYTVRHESVRSAVTATADELLVIQRGP